MNKTNRNEILAILVMASLFLIVGFGQSWSISLSIIYMCSAMPLNKSYASLLIAENDNNLYEVVTDKNGTKRWKKIKGE